MFKGMYRGIYPDVYPDVYPGGGGSKHASLHDFLTCHF